MAKTLIGTCSWTDPSLIAAGTFYPPEIKTPEARLRYYALHFPIVEVDSSYYALPGERTSALWAARTPSHFLFDIKAFSLFTHHPTRVRSLPKDILTELPVEVADKDRVYLHQLPQEAVDELWTRFQRSLAPLVEVGKMSVVVCQFPPWYTPSRANREYISRVHSEAQGAAG